MNKEEAKHSDATAVDPDSEVHVAALDSQADAPNRSRAANRSRTRSVLTVFSVTAVIMLGIFSQIDNWKRDLTTNFARLDSQASDELLRPVQLSEPPEKVSTRILAWVEAEKKWNFVERKDSQDGIELVLTRTTSLMRFTDDIHVHLDAAEGGTYVRADSRSRIGKGDLGQNPRNLKELVGVLTQDR